MDIVSSHHPPRLARIRAIRAAISSCIDIPLAAPPLTDVRAGGALPFVPLDRLPLDAALEDAGLLLLFPSIAGALLSTVCVFRNPPFPNDDISPNNADLPPPPPPPPPPPLPPSLTAALGAVKEGAAGGPGGGGAAEDVNEGAAGGAGGAGGAALDIIGGGGGVGGGAEEQELDIWRGGGGGTADLVGAGGGGGGDEELIGAGGGVGGGPPIEVFRSPALPRLSSPLAPLDPPTLVFLSLGIPPANRPPNCCGGSAAAAAGALPLLLLSALRLLRLAAPSITGADLSIV